MIPEHQDSCHHYWCVARNYALDHPEFSENFRKFTMKRFEEDKTATRLMQRMLTCDKHAYRVMNVAADKAGMSMRVTAKKLADAELQ